MEELAIKIEHVSKEYRLGAIGGGTLKGDLQSWWARTRGKEDPNSKIGSARNIKIGDRFLALDDINLEVKKGEALGIIGHNGAGKSTLLKLLSRVTAPSEGTISINGRIASMLEVGTGFHPELTGRENVYMNGAILGMTKAEIARKFDEIVSFAEMEKFIDTPVKRYSSGMYVKLAFSVAAHLDNEIMVMDEVLAVGDMAFQKKCLAKMRSSAKEEGRTVLYVSHNMNTIRQLCDRCVVLDHGHLIFDGNVEDAINIYLGRTDEYSNDVEITDSFRPLGSLKSNILLTRFSTEEKECCFEFGSRLPFSLVVKNCGDNAKSCYARVVIHAANGDAVSMCGTEKTITFEPGLNTKRFSIDISYFVPGKYYLDIILFEMGGLAVEKRLDCAQFVYNFFIVEKPGFNYNRPWYTPGWGHVNNGFILEEFEM